MPAISSKLVQALVESLAPSSKGAGDISVPSSGAFPEDLSKSLGELTPEELLGTIQDLPNPVISRPTGAPIHEPQLPTSNVIPGVATKPVRGTNEPSSGPGPGSELGFPDESLAETNLPQFLLDQAEEIKARNPNYLEPDDIIRQLEAEHSAKQGRIMGDTEVRLKVQELQLLEQMGELDSSSTAFLRNLEKKLEGIKRGGGGSDVFDIETPNIFGETDVPVTREGIEFAKEPTKYPRGLTEVPSKKVVKVKQLEEGPPPGPSLVRSEGEVPGAGSIETDPGLGVHAPEIDFLGENTEQLMMRVRYMVDKATPKKGDKARLKKELNTPEEIADPNKPFHLEGETHFDALTRNAVNQVSEATEGDRLSTVVFGPTITTGKGASKVTKQKPATMEHFSFQDIRESLGPEAEDIIRAIPEGTTVGGQTRGAQGRQLLEARERAGALKAALTKQVNLRPRQTKGFSSLRPDAGRPDASVQEAALSMLSQHAPGQQGSLPLGASGTIAGSTGRTTPNIVTTLAERSKRATSGAKQRPGVSQRQVLDTQIKNRLRRQAEGRQGVKKGLGKIEQRLAERSRPKGKATTTPSAQPSLLSVLKNSAHPSQGPEIEAEFARLIEQGMTEMQAFEQLLGVIR
jgi:hypothetical protein